VKDREPPRRCPVPSQSLQLSFAPDLMNVVGYRGSALFALISVVSKPYDLDQIVCVAIEMTPSRQFWFCRASCKLLRAVA
jgi:hypothetical protein